MPVSEYYKGEGSKVMKGMKERYGPEKGKEVFYATANKTGMKPGEDAEEDPTKRKMYLTSEEHKRLGLPSTEEQIRRHNELMSKVRKRFGMKPPNEYTHHGQDRRSRLHDALDHCLDRRATDEDKVRCSLCGESIPSSQARRDQGYVYCPACAKAEGLLSLPKGLASRDVSRGSEQERWLRNMVAGTQGSVQRELRGRASQYGGNYQRSFQNLQNRMKAAGYGITRDPGPKGGEWGARYKAYTPEEMREAIPSPSGDAAYDEHEGFAKLEHSLAHKKGVNDPGAVAYHIGVEKYGKEGMAKKAAAGRAKDDDEGYVLRGVTEQGKVMYYTGRAGSSWVSDNPADAFEYHSQQEARRKATMFNTNTSLHGVRFIAVGKQSGKTSDRRTRMHDALDRALGGRAKDAKQTAGNNAFLRRG